MSLRVVFFGTPQFAVPSLRALVESPHQVAAVVTQPDRPRGRGRRLSPSPVKSLAHEAGLTVLTPDSLRDEAFLQEMEQMRPDIGVVVAYGKILPREVLDLPPYGCINVHASLLPKYRGAAPIAWALLQGEVVTGVSVIRMVERLDAGDILMARTISIGEEEDALELGERLARVGAEALIDTLQGLEEGTLRPIPQREEEASYAPRLKKSDGELRWEQTAEMLHRRVRALVPWPGAFTFWEGKRLKVHRASVREGPSLGKPGQVVRASGGDLWVQTGDGYLALVEIQLEGRPSMRATVFLQGYPSIAGSMLG